MNGPELLAAALVLARHAAGREKEREYQTYCGAKASLHDSVLQGVRIRRNSGDIG